MASQGDLFESFKRQKTGGFGDGPRFARSGQAATTETKQPKTKEPMQVVLLMDQKDPVGVKKYLEDVLAKADAVPQKERKERTAPLGVRVVEHNELYRRTDMTDFGIRNPTGGKSYVWREPVALFYKKWVLHKEERVNATTGDAYEADVKRKVDCWIYSPARSCYEAGNFAAQEAELPSILEQLNDTSLQKVTFPAGLFNSLWDIFRILIWGSEDRPKLFYLFGQADRAQEAVKQPDPFPFFSFGFDEELDRKQYEERKRTAKDSEPSDEMQQCILAHTERYRKDPRSPPAFFVIKSEPAWQDATVLLAEHAPRDSQLRASLVKVCQIAYHKLWSRHPEVINTQVALLFHAPGGGGAHKFPRTERALPINLLKLTKGFLGKVSTAAAAAEDGRHTCGWDTDDENVRDHLGPGQWDMMHRMAARAATSKSAHALAVQVILFVAENFPCESCRDKFSDRISNPPIEDIKAEELFEHLVEIHNEVNVERGVCKFTLEQAKLRYLAE